MSDKKPADNLDHRYIDGRVIAFYQAKTLSASRMQLLLAQSQSARSRKWIPLYAAAAVLLLVIASVVHRHSLVSERTDIALREAAMNHITKLQMDFESPDLEQLKTSMSKLNFTLKLPAGSGSDMLTLVGARYCTIAGNLAAHLRFDHDNSDKQLSLFMTPVASALEDMISDDVDIDGVNVRLWQEGGLFYALADSPVAL